MNLNIKQICALSTKIGCPVDAKAGRKQYTFDYDPTYYSPPKGNNPNDRVNWFLPASVEQVSNVSEFDGVVFAVEYAEQGSDVSQEEWDAALKEVTA